MILLLPGQELRLKGNILTQILVQTGHHPVVHQLVLQGAVI